MNWEIILRSLGHQEMRKRILAVLGMLVVFRILSHIHIPLGDATTLKQLLDNLFNQTGSGLLGYLNVLSGGALENFSIVLVGLQPYITASIIMQVLTKAVPKLEAINKEGEFGRRKINQMTRTLTILITMLQAPGYIATQITNKAGVVGDPSTFWYIQSVLILVTGTMFVMWLGEKITDKGFEPQFITVSVGTIVTWNNTDSFLHSVASNPFPESSEHPDLKTAKPINTGDNYTYRVNKPGTYNYHDPLYPERGGTVQVTNSTE